MVKNIYRKNVGDMSLSEVRDFVVAPREDKFGKQGLKRKVNLAIATVRDTLFAKFNHVVHGFVSGEWITDEKIRQNLLKNINELKGKKGSQTREEKLIIENTVREVLQICKYLEKKGVPPERFGKVYRALTELADSAKSKAATVKEGDEGGMLAELATHEEEVAERIRVEEREETPAVEEEEEIPERVMDRIEEEVDLSKLGFDEKRAAIAKGLGEVIELAYNQPFPTLRRGTFIGESRKESVPGKPKWGHEIVTLVNPLDYLTFSLGQKRGANSSDNKKLKKIQKEAQEGFKNKDAKYIKKAVDNALELIEKGFKQQVRATTPVIDSDGYEDSDYEVHFEKSAGLRAEIQDAVERLREYKKAL